MRFWFSVVVFTVAQIGVQQAFAVVAPLIAKGDHLFVSAQKLGCESVVFLVDHAEVGEDGKATFMENIELVAEGKPVHRVVSELADAVAETTGRRPQTIEIARVAPGDHERIRHHLFKLLGRAQSGFHCGRPETPDQNPVWRFDYEIARHSTGNLARC